MNFATVLAWVQAGGAVLTEGKALYEELKQTFSTEDQALLDAEVEASDAAADAAHKESQQ